MKPTKPFKIFILFIVGINFTAMAQPTSWTSKGVGGGGAIVSASISPFNQNEFYLTCDMSNLFRSTELGLKNGIYFLKSESRIQNFIVEL